MTLSMRDDSHVMNSPEETRLMALGGARHDIHPDYSRVRGEFEHSPNTFVLLPSVDLDVCVAETVRRQIGRPFARSLRRRRRLSSGHGSRSTWRCRHGRSKRCVLFTWLSTRSSPRCYGSAFFHRADLHRGHYDRST